MGTLTRLYSPSCTKKIIFSKNVFFKVSKLVSRFWRHLTWNVKESSGDDTSLSKIWQMFRVTDKNNQDELRKFKNIIRKGIFCIFSRKNFFWKNHRFSSILMKWPYSHFSNEIMIFCAWCLIFLCHLCARTVCLHVWIWLS